MASESYIERLQREKKLFLAYIRAVVAWHDALDHANNTGRKGDAYRIADEKRVAMKDAYSTIEPLLAEGDKK